MARKDAVVDGWESEAFHDAAKDQLTKLQELLLKGAPALKAGDLAGLAVAGAPSGVLRPAKTAVVYTDSALRVLRPAEAADPAVSLDMAAALNGFPAPLIGAETRDLNFKIYRVRMEEKPVETDVIVHATVRAGDETIQQNAVWSIAWQSTPDAPLIRSLTSTSYEEILARWPGGRLFTDCTAGLAAPEVPGFHQQLGGGMPYWSQRLDARLGIEPTGYVGISLGDANGDLLDDLYVSQTGGLPNRLFLQKPDGTLEDATETSGTGWLDNSRASLFVDLDNDGDEDLAIVTTAGLALMENDGSARFASRGLIQTSGALFSPAAADPDGDGDTDIYLCSYGNVWGGLGDSDHHVPLPMHDANNGAPNILLQNQGGWQFKDVTAGSGLDENNTRWSLSAAWNDFDRDGDADLYVANDFGRNNLYRNDTVPGGPLRFKDIAAEAGVEDLSPGMSASWGDPNNDGWPDLYVSNMFSGAGNRIAYQTRFQSSSDDSRSGLQRMSKGNSFFLNRNGQTAGAAFDDISDASGTTVGKWAWASRFADVNNDGREDILVANGFMTQPEDPGDL